MSNQEYKRGLINRDQNIMNEFVRLYRPLVMSCVSKVIDNEEDIKDLVQEIFIKILNKIETYDESKALTPWVARISYNHCIDFIRKRNVKCKLMGRYREHVHSFDVVNAPEEEDYLQAVNVPFECPLDMLNMVKNERDRYILYLRLALGWRYKRIASLLDVNVATIKTRVHEYRKWLHQRCIELRGQVQQRKINEKHK